MPDVSWQFASKAGLLPMNACVSTYTPNNEHGTRKKQQNSLAHHIANYKLGSHIFFGTDALLFCNAMIITLERPSINHHYFITGFSNDGL
jgi:hypothetical protein